MEHMTEFSRLQGICFLGKWIFHRKSCNHVEGATGQLCLVTSTNKSYESSTCFGQQKKWKMLLSHKSVFAAFGGDNPTKAYTSPNKFVKKWNSKVQIKFTSVIIPVTCCIIPFIRYSPKVRELHEISPPFLVKHTFPFPIPCVAAQAQLQRGKRKRGNGVLQKHRFNEPSLGGPFFWFLWLVNQTPPTYPPAERRPYWGLIHSLAIGLP